MGRRPKVVGALVEAAPSATAAIRMIALFNVILCTGALRSLDELMHKLCSIKSAQVMKI
jgi:hypothetical protein